MYSPSVRGRQRISLLLPPAAKAFENVPMVGPSEHFQNLVVTQIL
jgi:hypothetical protein